MQEENDEGEFLGWKAVVIKEGGIKLDDDEQ